jgi:trans-2,3-dihydro-3-hydroxyanthranilate isomerase
MRRKFFTLDVFTNRAFAGNPLAVVLDADDLDGTQMQAISREFNLSETVFVLTPRDPIHTARLRIFTPARELPFAGHPTIGTAVLLGEMRAPEMLGREDIRIVLEEEVGPVVCIVRHLAGQAARASFELPRLPVYAGPLGETSDLARALGVAPDDIGFGRHQPGRFNAGVPYACVPLGSRQALASVKPDVAHWQQALNSDSPEGIFVYCDEPADAKHRFRARMFAPTLGIWEDPATGGAVAAFAGALARFETLADGDHAFVIEQGFEMGRPSLITLGLNAEQGGITGASIGGSAVIVTQGTMEF